MGKSEIRAEIAANIRAERARRHMSQRALGEAVGLTRIAVCDIECGRRSLKAQELVVLCQVLDIDIDTIIGTAA